MRKKPQRENSRAARLHDVSYAYRSAAMRLACLTRFTAAAVSDQIFNGHHRHRVLFRKGDRFRRMGHRAVVVGQLAQYACRFETGQRH